MFGAGVSPVLADYCPTAQCSRLIGVSASSPLVGFGELNDNTIKDLTSLRSVE
jgi:hypothetical protein